MFFFSLHEIENAEVEADSPRIRGSVERRWSLHELIPGSVVLYIVYYCIIYIYISYFSPFDLSFLLFNTIN